VLLNFVSNAIKYSNENGIITIVCSEVDANRIRIRVSDAGPGIPEKSLSNLFEPFNRLDKCKSDIQGTGIGLTISKK